MILARGGCAITLMRKIISKHPVLIGNISVTEDFEYKHLVGRFNSTIDSKMMTQTIINRFDTTKSRQGIPAISVISQNSTSFIAEVHKRLVQYDAIPILYDGEQQLAVLIKTPVCTVDIDDVSKASSGKRRVSSGGQKCIEYTHGVDVSERDFRHETPEFLAVGRWDMLNGLFTVNHYQANTNIVENNKIIKLTLTVIDELNIKSIKEKLSSKEYVVYIDQL